MVGSRQSERNESTPTKASNTLGVLSCWCPCMQNEHRSPASSLKYSLFRFSATVFVERSHGDIGKLVDNTHTANLILPDDQLSYQYTTGERGPFAIYGDVGVNDKGYSSHDGYYLILLPWRHKLRLRGAYIQSRADLSDPLVSASDTAIASATYSIPLGRIEGAFVEAYGQATFNHSEREIFFNGVSASETAFDTALFGLGLRGVRQSPGQSFSLSRFAVTFSDTGRENQTAAGGKDPTATRSGGWLAHCHILEHAARGMTTFFEIKEQFSDGFETGDTSRWSITVD